MTPEQAKELVATALAELLPNAVRSALPRWYVFALGLLVLAVVAFIAAYVGSYLQAKGQRRALEEGLEDIERKTADIKAEVSGGLWLKQKRWDLRREVYSNLLTGLDDLFAALHNMKDLQTKAPGLPQGDERQKIEESLREARATMSAAQRAVARARGLGQFLLHSDSVRILDRMAVAWNPVNEQLEDGTPAAASDVQKLIGIVLEAIGDLTSAARKDLLEEAPR